MSSLAAAEPVGSRAPSTLMELAYGELEERIVTLRLKPGQFVSEHALAAQLGLGRTPIREALQRLVREGLVSVLPRRGILVSTSDPAQQLLVLEVRRELERLLSRTAAERASGAQRQEFRAIAEGMTAASGKNDELAFMRLDRALNILVTEAAHNEFAAGAMRLINGHSRRFWYQHYKQAADMPLCARLHAEQARAISDGNGAQAATASDRLIDYTETFTRAAAGKSRGHTTMPPTAP